VVSYKCKYIKIKNNINNSRVNNFMVFDLVERFFFVGILDKKKILFVAV